MPYVRTQEVMIRVVSLCFKGKHPSHAHLHLEANACVPFSFVFLHSWSHPCVMFLISLKQYTVLT